MSHVTPSRDLLTSGEQPPSERLGDHFSPSEPFLPNSPFFLRRSPPFFASFSIPPRPSSPFSSPRQLGVWESAVRFQQGVEGESGSTNACRYDMPSNRRFSWHRWYASLHVPAPAVKKNVMKARATCLRAGATV